MPYRAEGKDAQSPTAYTSGSEVRSAASAVTDPSGPRAMPEPASQPVAGRAPIPTTTAPAATVRPSARTTLPGSIRGHRGAGEQFGAALRVPAGHRGGDLGGQDARERPVGGLDDGDLAARLAGCGGELGADPARADDHDGVLLVEDRPQPCGVVEGAQQMHAGHPLGAGQHHRFGAGGDDQDVVRDGARLGVQFVRVGP